MLLPYLYRPVSLANDLQFHPLSICMDSDLSGLDRHNGSWHLLRLILRWIRKWEQLGLRDWQKATKEGLFKTPIIGADRMVNSHEVSSGREGTLYHKLGE